MKKISITRNYFLLFLFAFMCLAYVTPAAAQDDDMETTPEEQTFRFVYIAQDESMPLQTLLTELQDAYNHAIAEGPTIFYLSNGNEPVIVRVNMDGDNREDFENILLSNIKEHFTISVDGAFDKQKITALLKEYDFIDSERHLNHASTDMAFHVGKSFWEMNNNEVLIAALFFELDIRNFITDENFNFNVYLHVARSQDDIDNESPFGVMNLDGINQTISLQRKY